MKACEGGSLRVLYAEHLPADLQSVVLRAFPAGLALDIVSTGDREELLRRCEEADFLVVRQAVVDEELLGAAPRLRHIQHQGVGADNIDLLACARHRVSVSVTPEGTIDGAAEHTMLLILALYRNLREAETELRAGRWPTYALRMRSFELRGKKLGLLGFGRIGQAVARRASSFDARVIYWSRSRAASEVERQSAARYAALDDLLMEADIVSLHLPLTAETRGLVSHEKLALMQRHAVLINTARGQLIDEGALAHALKTNQIAGAALDVLCTEPPGVDNPLLSLHNVVLTPHIAAGTIDGFRAKMGAIGSNLLRAACGETPRNLLAPGEGCMTYARSGPGAVD